MMCLPKNSINKYFFIFLFLTSSLVKSQITIIELEDYKNVKVYNGIHLELIKSDTQKIEVSGKKKEKLKIKNSRGTVKISLKFPNLYLKEKLHIKLFYNKDIILIDANEGSLITSKGIKQPYLEAKAQEGATIDLQVKTKHLKIKSITGGIIIVKGNTQNQEIDIDLYGVYKAYGLDVLDKTSINAGTGAKAEINSGEIMDVKVSFGGSVFYKGTPKIIQDKKIAGGIIKQMN